MAETEKMGISLDRDSNGNTITMYIHNADSDVWDWLKAQGLGISKPSDGKTQSRWITILAEVNIFKRSKC